MANINIPDTKDKEYNALLNEYAQIADQIKKLKAGDYSSVNFNNKNNNVENNTAGQTINTPDSYAWDIINDPEREQYDLRNYKNFRMNNDNLNDRNKTSSLAPNPNRTYRLSDICYAEHLDFGTNSKLNPLVQTIVLNEFQPNATIQVGKLLTQIAEGATGGFLDFVSKLSDKATSVAGIVKGVAGAVAGDYIQQKMLDYYSKNPDSLYGGNIFKDSEKIIKSFLGDNAFGSGVSNLAKAVNLDPISQIRRMFHGGKWLNTYELPFFKDIYLETSKGGSWSNEGVNQVFGEKGTMRTVASKLKLNFPTAPVYEIREIGSSGYSAFEFKFYLINKDQASLLRNFQFLHAFFSGTQWVSMLGGMIKCPNVYNVHVPGRFHLYWATLTCKITAQGKLTQIPLLKDNIVFKELNSVKNTNPLWPEAWEVECHVTDLTPNNFNTYIDYLVDGWDRGVIATLEDDTSVAGAIGKGVNYVMEKGGDFMAMGSDLMYKFLQDKNSEAADRMMAEDQKMSQNNAAVLRRISELSAKQQEIALKLEETRNKRS